MADPQQSSFGSNFREFQQPGVPQGANFATPGNRQIPGPLPKMPGVSPMPVGQYQVQGPPRHQNVASGPGGFSGRPPHNTAAPVGAFGPPMSSGTGQRMMPPPTGMKPPVNGFAQPPPSNPHMSNYSGQRLPTSNTSGPTQTPPVGSGGRFPPPPMAQQLGPNSVMNGPMSLPTPVSSGFQHGQNIPPIGSNNPPMPNAQVHLPSQFSHIPQGQATGPHGMIQPGFRPGGPIGPPPPTEPPSMRPTPRMSGPQPPGQGQPLPLSVAPPTSMAHTGQATKPTSQKSSRAPSPVSPQTYDALEGQFTPSSQGMPPPPQSFPPQTSSGAPPPQDMNQRSSGITGRRQYPQMSGLPGTTTSASLPLGPQPMSPSFQPGAQISGQNQGYQGGNQTYTSATGSPSGFQRPDAASQQSRVGAGYPNNISAVSQDFGRFGISDSQRVVNLMQERQLISPEGLETVKPALNHDYKKVNCNPDIFRCTLNAIPQSSSLLNKARLPLGIIIHPFKDLSQLPVIQSSVIVRCRSCRTYINPFVHFVDSRRWKCNLCYRVNELPDEFSFDPVSKTYGDPQRRPEVRSATIEFIAPSEYMLRPPQPAVYLFLLDVSFNGIETGYLNLFCQTLLDELDKVPGDARTQVGFLAYDRFLYFFSLAEGLSQPQMLIVPDLEDIFLPCPDNLLVNLHESKDLIVDLLNQLPSLFEGNHETGSALGAALQAAYKLTSSSGGRVTVMQTVLPTVGPGALHIREQSNQDNGKNVPHLGPATDFYKKLALDCSAQQISVDLYMLNGQYADIATLSCISKYSAGCINYYPAFHTLKNPSVADKFDADLRRYLTRKIGFESVMRIRCTRGLSIHTFHGNFFVRSTDLLSLPNINPDAGFGMQMSIEDSLTETSTVCFQAALLYTSSKGERRIRVHTLCLPVTNQMSNIYAGADQQAIIGLLAKMAVDRSISSSLGDARDALINAALDSIQAYGSQVPASQRMGAMPLPYTIRIMPLYILAMLKSLAFRLSSSIKLDDRVFLLQQCKTLPLANLLQIFHPHLYPVHSLEESNTVTKSGVEIPKPPLLQLSSANIDRHGVYLMDTGDSMYLMVGGAISDQFCQEVLDKPNFMTIPEGMNDLPELDNPSSERLRTFINFLMDNRPFGATFVVLREDSKMRHLFFQHMVEDRTESSMSYYEFLQYLQQRAKS